MTTTRPPASHTSADRSTSGEIGELSGQHENFYWKVKSLHRLRYLATRLASLPGVLVFAGLYPVILVVAVVVRCWLRFTAAEDGPARDDVRQHALATYDRFFAPYPTAVYSPLVKSLELGYFARYSLDGPSVDVAVGDGFFSSLLAERGRATLTYGIDLIYETIRSSAKYRTHKVLTVADSDELPFADGSLRTIVMNNLMHHLPDRRRALTEAARVLAPGGQLLFTDNLAGWTRFTVDYRVLDAIGLGSLARLSERLKLALFAQKLVASESFWREPFVTAKWDVVEISPFVSRRAMTISSLFEYLNLKQGQPTHRPFRWILRLPLLRRLVVRQMTAIARQLILDDPRACRDGGAAFVFVALKKRGTATAIAPDAPFACPRCHTILLDHVERYACPGCGRAYPVFDGIPIFISYADAIPRFEDHLAFSRSRKAREHVT